MTTPKHIMELQKLGIKPLVPFDSIIYKYVPFDTAEKIINSGSLMFSAPITFNDPFDLNNNCIDASFTEKSLKRWFRNNKNLTRGQKKILLDQLLKNPKSMDSIVETSLNTFKAEAGITCFSKTYLNTLMWSHYADKHYGICLGFNILPIANENFTLLEINYADKIIPLNFFSADKKVLMYWLFTKSEVWSYEQEVRGAYLTKNGLIPFENDCLKEIHFGLRTSEDQRQAFLKSAHVNGYRPQKSTYMTMDLATFNLAENLIPLTWTV